MARNKISTTVYITQEQNELLKSLSQKTRVPVASYIREGIDMVLERHKKLLPGQMTFDDVDGRPGGEDR
jgi:predicted DNA-binding protein